MYTTVPSTRIFVGITHTTSVPRPAAVICCTLLVFERVSLRDIRHIRREDGEHELGKLVDKILCWFEEHRERARNDIEIVNGMHPIDRIDGDASSDTRLSGHLASLFEERLRQRLGIADVAKAA